MIPQHHERMDGSGYPRGLKGDQVMPEARNPAVADVVEAMSSHRPYRASLGVEAALEEIETNKASMTPRWSMPARGFSRAEGFPLSRP